MSPEEIRLMTTAAEVVGCVASIAMLRQWVRGNFAGAMGSATFVALLCLVAMIGEIIMDNVTMVAIVGMWFVAAAVNTMLLAEVIRRRHGR